MRGMPFLKMHGLGNDFVVLDGRERSVALDASATRAIADRRTGIGCDQLIILELPQTPGADVFMRIRNADGSEIGTCGNATRCIADVVMRETGRDSAVIETPAGVLEAVAAGTHRVRVDMGPARIGWREIPLARECDTLHAPLALGPLADPVCTSIGNPHATFFVADVEAIDLAALGPRLERDALFPAGANIGIARILSPTRLRLRVWERGAGITTACGSGACAAAVAARRRDLTECRVEVLADGGALDIEWREDGHVLMTGPVAVSFSGTIDPALWS